MQTWIQYEHQLVVEEKVRQEARQNTHANPCVGTYVYIFVYMSKRVVGKYADGLPPYLTSNNGTRKQIDIQASKQTYQHSYICTTITTYLSVCVLIVRALVDVVHNY